jgi:DNA-binding HxlR family transcriptional regulator
MTRRTGRAATETRTARPMNELLEILGRRWALRIVWELRETALSSRALAARCGGVSPTVLHKRLRELRDANIVELLAGEGYELSARGSTLVDAMRPLERWAGSWLAG